jgi:nitroreductase
VRFFEQHEPVPENVLQDVLEVARWSGSARNRQPWEFVVVSERETLESLAACEGRAAHLANAALGIVLGSGSSLSRRPSTRGGSLRGSRSQPLLTG